MPLEGGKSPTTRASAKPCPRCNWRWSAARGWSWRRIWAGPKGKPDPKYSLEPVAARLAELLGKPGRLRGRLRRAPKPKRRAGRCATAACCCSRTSATIPKKKPTTKNFSRQLAALCDRAFCLRRVRLGASRARVGGGHHEIREAVRRGPADGEGTRLSRQSDFESGAAVRRHPRRRESLRQNRSGAEPDEAGRRHADRRRPWRTRS